MGNFLGIDSSTQSMTGIVIDTDRSAIVAEASVSFDEHYGERYGVTNGVIDLGDGRIHSAPLMWAEALEQLCCQLRDAGVDLRSIRAVAGSGQQHGTVYLNESAALSLGGLDADHDLAGQLEGMFPAPRRRSAWTLPLVNSVARSRPASADAKLCCS